MKILDTSLIVDPSVQQPFTGPSLQFIEDSYKEALAALAKMKSVDATKVTVLFGCVNSTPGTTTFTISAGAVYYNGEIYLVPAATLTTSGNVVVINLVDTNTLGNQTFSDGIARTTSHDRTGVFALGTSGSGSLTGNASSDYTSFLGIWHNVGDTGEPAFMNGWANKGSSSIPLSYRIMNDGLVILRGELDPSGQSGNTIFTLPAGYRPTKAVNFPVNYTDGSSYNTTNLLGITSGGVVQVNPLNATVAPVLVSLGTIIFDTK